MRSCMMGSSLRGACRAAWCSPSTSLSSPSSGTVSFTRTRDRLGVGGAGGTQMPRLHQLHQALCFHQLLSLTRHTDTLLNVFLAIAVDNLANAQELTKVEGTVTTCSWQIMTAGFGGMWGLGRALAGHGSTGHLSWSHAIPDQDSLQPPCRRGREQ